jgi:hypothetical protein
MDTNNEYIITIINEYTNKPENIYITAYDTKDAVISAISTLSYVTETDRGDLVRVPYFHLRSFTLYKVVNRQSNDYIKVFEYTQQLSGAELNSIADTEN